MKNALAKNTSSVHADVEELISIIKEGGAVLLVDDEDRENEGDIVFAAEFVTPELITFMATFGQGLICLALTQEQADRMELSFQPKRHVEELSTNFTVSIEAREGVTSGISAADRAQTVKVATSPQVSAADIATPGHMFPIVARAKGTLERAGHTEAAVDLARIAGLQPAGVICEVMLNDGTMARLPALEVFAKDHDLKIGRICDIIAYRQKHGV